MERFDADRRVIEKATSGKGAFHVRHPDAGRHVEADLSRQVLALIQGDRVVATMTHGSHAELMSVPSLVTLAGYVIAVAAGRIPLRTFAKEMIAPQAVAISTQSSLASLPAMLGAARLMGIAQRIADVTLPLAVALFRATGPAMNVAVVIYMAHWLSVDITPERLIAQLVPPPTFADVNFDTYKPDPAAYLTCCRGLGLALARLQEERSALVPSACACFHGR